MHLCHKWKLAATQEGVYKDVSGGQDVGWFTWLLYQCDVCPKCKVEQIKGHWKRVDFKAEK